MKKLNKKGMTTVEVLICFVLTIILVVSMYSTISAYSAKRSAESNRETIIRYKNIVTKDIMSDLIKNGLINAEIDPGNISNDKSLKPNYGDGKGVAKYGITLYFKNGTSKRLEISRNLAVTSGMKDYTNVTSYEYQLFGDVGNDNDLDSDDCRIYQDFCEIENKGGCHDAPPIAYFASRVEKSFEDLCIGNTIRSDYKVRVPDNTKMEAFKDDGSPGPSNLRWLRKPIVDEEIYTEAETAINDYFSIFYDGETYTLPDIGYHLNDYDRIVYDLRFKELNISTDNNVLRIYIGLNHNDFGNRYAINIVYPFNF